MDIISPEIIQIGNRFYRKNPLQHSNKEEEEEVQANPYFDEDPIAEECAYNDEEEEDLDIEETRNGFRLTVPVPSIFHGFLIGHKGETRKRLEMETKTQIRIPRMGTEGPLTIEGWQRSGLVSAKTRIDMLVQSARQKSPFTHFLCFPMNASSELIKHIEEFRSAVLTQCVGERGIDESIFQNPAKLHLTIGVSVLADAREVEAGRQLLLDCRSNSRLADLWEKPFDLRLMGLEYMNDDPAEVDVLYIKLVPSPETDRLQRLANELVDTFVSGNLMTRQYDRVKLHLTIMNTLFRKDPTGADTELTDNTRSRQRDKRESFDARHLFKRLGDFDFGKVTLNEVHLSQRYSTANDGFYRAAAKVTMG